MIIYGYIFKLNSEYHMNFKREVLLFCTGILIEKFCYFVLVFFKTSSRNNLIVLTKMRKYSHVGSENVYINEVGALSIKYVS